MYLFFSFFSLLKGNHKVFCWVWVCWKTGRGLALTDFKIWKNLESKDAFLLSYIQTLYKASSCKLTIGFPLCISVNSYILKCLKFTGPREHYSKNPCRFYLKYMSFYYQKIHILRIRKEKKESTEEKDAYTWSPIWSTNCHKWKPVWNIKTRQWCWWHIPKTESHWGSGKAILGMYTFTGFFLLFKEK